MTTTNHFIYNCMMALHVAQEDDIPPPSYTPPRSISPLGSQSRKATEDIPLPSSSFHIEIEALNSQLQKTRELLTEQESLVAALRKELGTAKAEASLLRSKVSEVSEKRSHDIASADKLMEDLRKDNDMLSRKKADLSHQVDQLNSKIEEVQTSLNDRIFELETECEYLRENKESGAESQLDELEAECEMLRSDKQRALIENLNLTESTNAKINDLEKQVASLSEEKVSLLSTVTSQQSEMEELKGSLASAQETAGRRISVKFDQSSMIADLKENLEQVKKELMAAKAAAMRKESAKEIRRESEESAALKEEVEKLRGELEAAKVAKSKAMGLAMKLVGSEAFLKQLSSASDMGAISQLKAALQSKVPNPPSSSSPSPSEASPPKETRRTSSPAVIKKEVPSNVETPKGNKSKVKASSSSRDLNGSSSSKGAGTASASVRSTSPSKNIMRGGGTGK
jgi:chromosome segregation ATPase